MKNSDHAAVITFAELESALEELVQLSHLAGLVIDDLIVLLNEGFGIKEILNIIAIKRWGGLAEDS